MRKICSANTFFTAQRRVTPTDEIRSQKCKTRHFYRGSCTFVHVYSSILYIIYPDMCVDILCNIHNQMCAMLKGHHSSMLQIQLVFMLSPAGIVNDLI